jgi:hypothetical protein
MRNLGTSLFFLDLVGERVIATALERATYAI